MLRDAGLLHLQLMLKVANGPFTFPQRINDSDAARVCERLEEFGLEMAKHMAIILPYYYITLQTTFVVLGPI